MRLQQQRLYGLSHRPGPLRGGGAGPGCLFGHPLQPAGLHHRSHPHLHGPQRLRGRAPGLLAVHPAHGGQRSHPAGPHPLCRSDSHSRGDRHPAHLSGRRDHSAVHADHRYEPHRRKRLRPAPEPGRPLLRLSAPAVPAAAHLGNSDAPPGGGPPGHRRHPDHHGHALPRRHLHPGGDLRGRHPVCL